MKFIARYWSDKKKYHDRIILASSEKEAEKEAKMSKTYYLKLEIIDDSNPIHTNEK